MTDSTLRFKVASRPAEFEQIHRLNYRTFVEEIPQHTANGGGILVDRFHEENTYVIALRGERLVGMVAARGERPFSLDEKLDDLDAYLPPGRSVCELRLLAVELDERRGPVFAGLVEQVSRHALACGWDVAVISGTVRQLRLYRHLGFEPFGPRVGTPEAEYQPMMLTLGRFCEFLDGARGFEGVRADLPGSEGPVNFTPGPVDVHPAVRARFEREPASHRGIHFEREMERVRASLRRLTGARHVVVLLGTGTLANDAVAAQLALSDTSGVVLANGEFGERLVDHARRQRLPAAVLRETWGRPFGRGALEHAADAVPEGGWLWAVHCETSTGVMNDLELLRGVSRDRGLRLCLDCISSIGATPVELAGIELATGVSGKAVGAYPGLSFVFHEKPVRPEPDRLPRYLDLGLYAERDNMPFTHSSNLVASLGAALDRLLDGGRYGEIRRRSERLREHLRASGFRILAADPHAAAAVITVPLPPPVVSAEVGRRLEARGFLLSWASDYLLRRNWIQVCLMSEVSDEDCDRLVAALGDAAGRSAQGM